MITLFATAAKIMFLAAVIPVIVLLVYVYRKDRTEPEPMGLLISLLVLGGLTTIAAYITEVIGENILMGMSFSSERSYNFWMYFLVVALSEEGFKYLVLRWRTWRDYNFNCTFDGVIYAVFVSLGFALVENLKYVFNMGIGTAIIRAFTAVPGHACFGVFMGAFYGLAKKYKNTEDHEVSRFFSVLALVAPVVLHGLYDYAATTMGSGVFLIVVIGLFVIARKMIKRSVARDGYIE